MKKKIIITGIVVAGVHFAAAMCSIISGLGALEAMDNPQYEPSILEKAAGGMADILVQPGAIIWTSWRSKNASDFVEWMLFIGNSLLWGFAIAILFNLDGLLRAKRKKANK